MFLSLRGTDKEIGKSKTCALWVIIRNNILAKVIQEKEIKGFPQG